MNRGKKVMLSILGGVDVTFYMITPIIIAVLWVNVIGLSDFLDYFFYAIGLISSIFRAIKVGWLDNGRTTTRN